MNSSFWVTYVILPGIFFIPTAFTIWHAFHHSFATKQEKLLWIALAVFTPPVGGIIYLCIGRKRATGRTGLGL